MKVALFSTKQYEQKFFTAINQTYEHELCFLAPRLDLETVNLVQNFQAICVFVNDVLDRAVLTKLASQGTKIIALRCAGYDNVDLQAAQELDLTLVRVPAYSPYAVAEHAIALILTLNRKIHRAYNRVREGNFSLNGLLGFDLHGKTVGIIGTGKIGRITGQILHGFGCEVVAYDPYPNQEFANHFATYLEFEQLLARAEIISLHCPLTKDNYHLIDQKAIAQMKPGVMLINTSRGGLIDTKAIIRGLKSKKIGYLALDVYEQEKNLFFEDLSSEIIQDDLFERLLTFPNVIITGHQAFLTSEALENIATTTLSNLTDLEQNKTCANQIKFSE